MVQSTNFAAVEQTTSNYRTSYISPYRPIPISFHQFRKRLKTSLLSVKTVAGIGSTSDLKRR